MTNKYTGEVETTLNGNKYKLVMTYEAIANCREEFGDTILSTFSRQSPKVVARIAALAMQKHHPEMTAEYIIAQSPPLIPLMEAIDQAITLAFFGIDGPPSERPKDDDTPKKK